MPAAFQQELTVWVALGPHKAAQVRLAVYEEGLPAPHEGDDQREPTVPEFDAIAALLATKQYREVPPFEVGSMFVRTAAARRRKFDEEERDNQEIEP